MISPFGGSSKISGVVNLLFINARTAQEVDSVQTQVQQLLHRRHRIGPREDDDFTVRSLSEIAQASESASAVMTLLLAAVASISLLVGGIGIMKIMLVSVTERREKSESAWRSARGGCRYFFSSWWSPRCSVSWADSRVSRWE